MDNNRQGGLLYVSAGEVNPIVTVERNQFRGNCQKLYGNFTTCKSAIDMDIQNTRTVYFRVRLRLKYLNLARKRSNFSIDKTEEKLFLPLKFHHTHT